MRRTRVMLLTVVPTLALLWLLASSQTPRPSPQITRVASPPSAELQLDRTFTTQQRINRYFHGDVIPKLRSCWSRVKGRGRIEIEHTYAKDPGGKWIVAKLKVGKSSLPRGQDAVALQCMRDSVRGTSFPVESGDGDGNSYVVNWNWPVPFPKNAATLTNAMFAAKPKGGGKGTDCDGEGSPPKCFNCGQGGTCVKVCVGYNGCIVSQTGISGSLCQTSGGTCASGGPFGVGGGGIIF